MMRSFRFHWAVVCAAVLAATPVSRCAEIEKFLPKDTDLVISLNVRQVLDSPLIKDNALELIKSALAGNKEVQTAITTLGLDPLKDFQRISVGMSLDDVTNPKALIVIDGKFDVKKIGDVMEGLSKSDPKQFALDKVSGKTVYKITSPDQPAPMYAAPLDGNVLVFGTSKELVADTFDAMNGTRKPVVKKEISELLAKSDANSSLYIVAHTKGRLDALPLPNPELKRVIDQVQSISIDLKVDKDARLELSIGTAAADEAKKIHEMLNGGLELARVQVKVAAAQQPELQPLVDLANSMTAALKDKSVVINGKVPGTSLEKLLQMK